MIERELSITVRDERIDGLLWLPKAASAHATAPVVIAGHGLGQHKRALFPPSLARDLTSRGIAVAAIDAPLHGTRASAAGTGDIGSTWRAYWSEHGASAIAREHSALIDTLATIEEVDSARVGYFGLSLSTQYGLGWLAREKRVAAAVLGLFGMPSPGIRLRQYAPATTCPVLFICQRHDELHPHHTARALFDAIGSRDKQIITSDGGHIAVPASAFERACTWLASRLAGPLHGP